MLVYDYMFRQPPSVLACFKASGASGVARYLDPFNPKGITKDEVADIHAAGLALHLFFETTGGANDPGYFTRAQGVTDCLNAVTELFRIGAPKGMLVWFAVDTNIEPSLVTEYANGIASVATDAIDPQLYGYQRLCEYASANFPHMGKRPAQTYGTPSVFLALWQHEQRDVCGVSVDIDDVSVPGWTTTVPTSATGGTMFKDDPDAQAFVKDVHDSLESIKAVLGTQAHHTHVYAATGTAVLTVGGKTSESLTPPVPGAAYFSSDDSLSIIGWSYPDGTQHFFQRGVEIVK